jgi:hypothetical protein
MRAYVLGAGASVPVYPLGTRLFEAIDEQIRSCGPCVDRIDYQKDWPQLKTWLATNSNPLLSQSYRNGNIEQIFTVLDLAEALVYDGLSNIICAAKKGAGAVKSAETDFDSLKKDIGEYRHMRNILLWAMEAFFLNHNDDDNKTSSSPAWNDLRRLASYVQPGDVVITFNYDSTVERVLYALGKWSPSDGYGTDIAFQRNENDDTPITLPPSTVRVLHLHGAVGWYERPSTTVAPIGTEIALDPILLRGLGIHHVDASLVSRHQNERQIMLHPTFLKAYGGEGHSHRIFSRIWKDALHALQRADKVTIIGYSLPNADSAAWTLLHTGCERGKTDVVNPNGSVLANQYSALLRIPIMAEPMTLGQWLDSKT